MHPYAATAIQIQSQPQPPTQHPNPQAQAQASHHQHHLPHLQDPPSTSSSSATAHSYSTNSTPPQSRTRGDSSASTAGSSSPQSQPGTGTPPTRRAGQAQSEGMRRASSNTSFGSHSTLYESSSSTSTTSPTSSAATTATTSPRPLGPSLPPPSSLPTTSSAPITQVHSSLPPPHASTSSATTIQPAERPASTSSKTLLQEALSKAQSAVLLDSSNNVQGAVSAYKESVRLLRVVMKMVEDKAVSAGRRDQEERLREEREGALSEEEKERRRIRREKRERDKEDEKRRLRVIHDTYQDRITMLLSGSSTNFQPSSPTSSQHPQRLPYSPDQSQPPVSFRQQYPSSPPFSSSQPLPSPTTNRSPYPTPSPTTQRSGFQFQTTTAPPLSASSSSSTIHPPGPVTSSTTATSNPFSQSVNTGVLALRKRPSVAALPVVNTPSFAPASNEKQVFPSRGSISERERERGLSITLMNEREKERLERERDRPSPPPSPMDPMMGQSTSPPIPTANSLSTTNQNPYFSDAFASSSTSTLTPTARLQHSQTESSATTSNDFSSSSNAKGGRVRTSRIALTPQTPPLHFGVSQPATPSEDGRLRTTDDSEEMESVILPDLVGYSVGNEEEDEDFVIDGGGVRRRSEASTSTGTGELDPYGGISNSPVSSPLFVSSGPRAPLPPPKDINGPSGVVLDSTKAGTISSRRRKTSGGGTGALELTPKSLDVGKAPGLVVRPASTEPVASPLQPGFSEYPDVEGGKVNGGATTKHQHSSSASSNSSTEPPQTAPPTQHSYNANSLPLPNRLRALSQPGEKRPHPTSLTVETSSPFLPSTSSSSSTKPPPLPTIGVGFPTSTGPSRKTSIPTPTSATSSSFWGMITSPPTLSHSTSSNNSTTLTSNMPALIRTTSVASSTGSRTFGGSRGNTPSPIPPSTTASTARTLINNHDRSTTPYLPPPSAPRRPFHLMRQLLTTIEGGGYVTPKLFIPKELWGQVGVKLVAVETKVRMMELLASQLEVTERAGDQMLLGGRFGEEKDAKRECEKFVKELEGMSEGVLVEVRGTLEKKLGYGTGGKKNSATSFSAWSSKLSRGLDRVTNGRSLDAPATYVEGIARVFRQSQFIDTHLQASSEQTGLYKHLTPADHERLDSKLKKTSDFFGQVVCQFVLRDVGIMLDKYVKRGGSWVGTD